MSLSKAGRSFPTWSEVLEVLQSLDYENADAKDAGERVVTFKQAMQTYKEKSRHMFPTWSEVLEVLQNLGYQKASENARKDTQAAPTTLKTGNCRAGCRGAQWR